MKTLLLFVCTLFGAFSFSQSTIYQETFETSNTFTLNTSDLGATTTYNTWLLNNTYNGGAGTFVCLGFPFSFTVVNAPAQPAAITGSPSSNYMHISAQAAISGGISCASYIPADGTCVLNESNFTKMTASISTLGFTGVEFDFWWTCGGSVTAFGEVYYSLDDGLTWVLEQSNLQGSFNWSQSILTNAAWDNQSSVMFGFRFLNTTAATAADPGFSVDEIIVSGMAASNAITTDPFPLAGWCFGSAQNPPVSFDATGTYNSGNVFTAQLSDASGSFTSPTDIGTLTSSASGPQMILSLIPGNIPVGAGYRIRVVASDPVTIGTDNGTDLEVYALPVVTLAPFPDVCHLSAPVTLTGGSPSGGTYSGANVQNGQFTTGIVGTFDMFYAYADVNGCTNNTSQPITVNPTPVITVSPQSPICEIDIPFELQYASPTGGTYSGTGVTVGNIFTPSTAGAGIYSIQYQYTDANGCSTVETFSLEVETCLSLMENALIGLSIYPNPTEDQITITADVELASIVLVDMNGRTVKSINHQGMVNLSDLKPGVYFVQMEYDGQQFTERIMIK